MAIAVRNSFQQGNPLHLTSFQSLKGVGIKYSLDQRVFGVQVHVLRVKGSLGQSVPRIRVSMASKCLLGSSYPRVKLSSVPLVIGSQGSNCSKG